MKKKSQDKSKSQSLKTDGDKSKSDAIEFLSIYKPKCSASLKSKVENFQVNSAIETASKSISLSIAPESNDFSPVISIRYNSDAGNCIYKLAFLMDFPSIQINTNKQLSRFLENHRNEDIFFYTGDEGLVHHIHKESEPVTCNRCEISHSSFEYNTYLIDKKSYQSKLIITQENVLVWYKISEKNRHLFAEIAFKPINVVQGQTKSKSSRFYQNYLNINHI